MSSLFRTWIEIDAEALRSNAEQFLKLIPPTTRFMAVIKSNAYGHGLVQVAKVLSPMFRGSTSKHWFGVDSIVEALRLRREGIKNRILVLGYTLPSRIAEAGANGIALTVSNFESLQAVAALPHPPPIHLKIDTGMYRQGFLPQDVFKLLNFLKRFQIAPEGIYTHFASAKDPDNRQYTEAQLSSFGDTLSEFERAGMRGMVRHAAASGGVLLFPESHLDMVRIGMGLYGYWPSPESKASKLKDKKFKNLKPVLAWKTVVGEVKEIPKGAVVGYDGTEQVAKKTKIAVLPVGYWHGYDRGFSGIGEVLVRGQRAKVLGRISMDMTVADVSGIRGVKTGDGAVLVGAQDKEAIWADEAGEKLGTTQYEFLTRINPLIRRITI